MMKTNTLKIIVFEFTYIYSWKEKIVKWQKNAGQQKLVNKKEDGGRSGDDGGGEYGDDDWGGGGWRMAIGAGDDECMRRMAMVVVTGLAMRMAIKGGWKMAMTVAMKVRVEDGDGCGDED
jgi:hypothetical protein